MTLNDWIETYKRDHTHPVNRATHLVGIPTIIASLPLIVLFPAVGISLFVLGWILQFIGHAFEGKAPSFFRDPRFLLVGAAWFGSRVRGALRRGAGQPAA